MCKFVSKQNRMISLFNDNPDKWFSIPELNNLLCNYSEDAITRMVYHVRKKGHKIVCKNKHFKLGEA
jgi:hypothetical protein